MKKCVACTSIINDNAVFCPICRKEQPHNDVKKISRIYCDACGNEIEENAVSCAHCGKIMTLYKSPDYYKNNIPDAIKKVMASILKAGIAWYILAYIQIGVYGIFLMVNLKHGRFIQIALCMGVIAVSVLNIIYATQLVKYRRRIQTDYVGIIYKTRFSINIILIYILNVSVAILSIMTWNPIFIVLFGATTLATLLLDSIGYRVAAKKNKEALLILENVQSNIRS